MCGEFGPSGRDDGEGVLDHIVTVVADQNYQCAACYGRIPQGAYHAQVVFVEHWYPADEPDDDEEDGEQTEEIDRLHLHLQCRDICEQLEWYGPDVVSDLEQDEERGPGWVAHHTAVAVWAAGGEYVRKAGDE